MGVANYGKGYVAFCRMKGYNTMYDEIVTLYNNFILIHDEDIVKKYGVRNDETIGKYCDEITNAMQEEDRMSWHKYGKITRAMKWF